MSYTYSDTISDETLSRIIDIESAGRANARARTSSALGVAQFLATTWLEELRQHRPDLINGPPYDDELELRRNPAIAIELLARFTEDNARELSTGCADADLYLAHFSGVKVARKLRLAAPDTPAAAIYSPAAVAANRSILQGKTVRQVRTWAASKMHRARTDWIDRLAPPLPRPRPDSADPAEHEESEPRPRPQPDDPGPAEPAPPCPPEPRPGLLRRIRNWLFGGGTAGGVGVLAWLTEPMVVVAIAAVLIAGAGLVLWFIGRKGREKLRGKIMGAIEGWRP